MSKKIPYGSQVLIYPMLKATIGAGFKNMAYYNNYKYVHFGIDCCTVGSDDFDAIASGNGVVLGTESRMDNSLGNIVVIKYSNVYLPTLNVCKDVIVRYYHLASCAVKKGDVVTAYKILGHVIRKHIWHNHVHCEIDTDIDNPFYTPQVAEASSTLLIRCGANDSSLLNPIDVFCVGKKQTAIVHPLAVYADKVKDAPKYKESDFVISSKVITTTENYQKLILPINKMRISAGYKNALYNKTFGFGHYGLDICSTNGNWNIYASGIGKVVALGLDRILGNVVAVVYKNVWNHKLNKVQDVVLRYNHLKSIAVKVGDEVNKNTVLGIAGSTGLYSTGVHLHLSADTDVDNPTYTPTLGGNSNIFKAGYRDSRDTSFNPAQILHCKTSASDYQKLSRNIDGYACADDIDIPNIT